MPDDRTVRTVPNEAQRDFAAAYKATFHAGGDHSARSGAMVAESYCEQFGFAHRTVQRWAERLLAEHEVIQP